VAGLMGAQGKKQMGLNHPRAGDLIAVAAEHAWFTYYYWLDDAKAPDFARTVDIHRKPGYDPVELVIDPKIPAVKLKILWRLLQKSDKKCKMYRVATRFGLTGLRKIAMQKPSSRGAIVQVAPFIAPLTIWQRSGDFQALATGSCVVILQRS